MWFKKYSDSNRKKTSIPVQARGVGGVAQTKDVRLIPLRLGDSTVYI